MQEIQNTTLTVSGMSCGSCVRHVGQALNMLDGVSAVDVQLREGKVLVRHDPVRAPTERLVAAIAEAGYVVA